MAEDTCKQVNPSRHFWGATYFIKFWQWVFLNPQPQTKEMTLIVEGSHIIIILFDICVVGPVVPICKKVEQTINCFLLLTTVAAHTAAVMGKCD